MRTFHIKKKSIFTVPIVTVVFSYLFQLFSSCPIFQWFVCFLSVLAQSNQKAHIYCEYNMSGKILHAKYYSWSKRVQCDVYQNVVFACYHILHNKFKNNTCIAIAKQLHVTFFVVVVFVTVAENNKSLECCM